ncbi:MAG TPA: transglycosylase domain-containing protein [Jatrophihabitantaceae bacterium]|nr:transglycosylase domain-containing protein [Jatrophihabitantaceae bacterium]
MASPGNQFPWSTVGRLAVVLLAASILTVGLALPYVGGLGLAARHEASKFLNTPCNLQETQPPRKTTLFANDGKTVIATLFTQDRQPIPLSQVPKSLQQALVATEDRRFYSHHGVDMRGLIRSAISTSGGDTQGGSTLTMQYVKQIRYYQAGSDVAKQQAAINQNLNRKIEDAKCAIYLENTKHESKDTILDNYLNIAFFGENAYGIQTAAETYFNKPASKLTLPESAMLVGLLRAPTEYDPFQYPQAARDRRNQVLQNLVDVHDLPQAEADKYKSTPINLATTRPPVVREGCANADTKILNVGFFCDYVVNWLETVGKVSDTQLTTGGLKVITTLDAGLQNSMQQHLQASMPAASPMTAVLPAVDPKNGNILAMATSKLYGQHTSTKDTSHTQLPIFTEYSAQGASTYKLFPLLAALQTGVPANQAIYTKQTPSISSTGVRGPVGYRPSNCQTSDPVQNGDAQETYFDTETMSSATAKSSNTYFVGLVDQLFGCDLKPVVDMASKLGMDGLQEPSGDANFTVAQSVINYGRAQELVLGDIGTSPLELAGAYAAVAGGGRYNAPAPVLSITDENGQTISVNRSPAVQVVSEQAAAEAVQILTGDTRYPGTAASQFASWYQQNPGSLVASKTGTSVAVVGNNDNAGNASLWFVGMTPDLVATSALINFDHPSAPAAGLPGLADPANQAYGAFAAQMWLDALAPSLSGKSWTWPSPTAVAGIAVPPITGMDLTTAANTLKAAGFKMVQLDQKNSLQCASAVPPGNVAFYGPQIALPGSTITVCPSNGSPPLAQPVPVPHVSPSRSPVSSSPPASPTRRRPGR